MEMKKKNSGLGYCILGVAGKLPEALNFFFFFFCARQKLEWLLPNSSTGARPSFEVVTGRQQVRRAGAAERSAARTTAPARTHDSAKARPRLGQRARDLDQTGRGRDNVLASRPRLEELVSRHTFWCRDLAEVRSKKSLVVT